MPERKRLYKGNVSYKPLFDTMSRRGIIKYDLISKYNISPTIVAKLVNDKTVTTDTIMYLCFILDCQPCDVLEYKKEV